MKVRILYDDGKHSPESIVFENLSSSRANELFNFYCSCALSLHMDHIKVVNLFVGKKCVKMLQNR